jgi:murein DD-endopeptidase MepM/ murein hydrolase activator NlpD
LKTISLIFFLFCGEVIASVFVTNNPFPGGVVVINFEDANSNPKAYYNSAQLYVQKLKKNQWQAIVGIPLLTIPGDKEIRIDGSSTKILKFKVKSHTYGEQHIIFSGEKRKYITQDITQTERIDREREILKKARKLFSDTELSAGFFILPIYSPVTSAFGLRRLYNGVESIPHTGIDFAGIIGDPVKSTATGKVILVGDYFYNGNSIFIDHGQGLISSYMHLSEITVKYGQKIEQGDVIGTIGQSGRATGPHLHWSVFMNGTVINPALLLEKK